MVLFGRKRGPDDKAPGRGLMQVTDRDIRLLCPADKHLLADLSFDGTLRIWDRRCKNAFVFDLSDTVPFREKARAG